MFSMDTCHTLPKIHLYVRQWVTTNVSHGFAWIRQAFSATMRLIAHRPFISSTLLILTKTASVLLNCRDKRGDAYAK
jgi:hypothetical protein